MRADAIVTLGCKVVAGEPSAALTRRIDLAARAFRAECAPRIIVTGGRRWGDHVEAVVMKRELIARGVPASAIVMELLSLSTLENCLFTAEIMGAQAQRVMLATCSWHMARAARNFRRLGFHVAFPPDAWLVTPPPTKRRWLRERVNTVVDWCMMPRASHG